jgi:hypothetical protein
MSATSGECPFEGCGRAWGRQGNTGLNGCGVHLWSATCQVPGCTADTSFVKSSTFPDTKSRAVCWTHKDHSDGWLDVHAA